MGRGKPLWILSADRRGLTDLARVRRGRFRWSRLEIMRVYGHARLLAARFGINASEAGNG